MVSTVRRRSSITVAVVIGCLATSAALGEDYNFVLAATKDRAAGRSVLVKRFDFPESAFRVVVEWEADARTWTDDLSVTCSEDGQSSGVFNYKNFEFFRVAADVKRPGSGTNLYYFDVWQTVCAMFERRTDAIPYARNHQDDHVVSLEAQVL